MSAVSKQQQQEILANLGQSKGQPDMKAQLDHDNHSNQRNPNNDAYWRSRGDEARPDNWREQKEANDSPSDR